MAMHYVVVADAARARVLEGGPLLEELIEVADLVHPDSRAPSRELVSDGPGRTQGGPGGAPSSMEGADAHREEARLFAREVAGFVHDARTRGAFERLIVVAPPRFLGMLRDDLDKVTERMVVASIAKDLTRVETRDLPSAIRKDLPDLAGMP